MLVDSFIENYPASDLIVRVSLCKYNSEKSDFSYSKVVSDGGVDVRFT